MKKLLTPKILTIGMVIALTGVLAISVLSVQRQQTTRSAAQTTSTQLYASPSGNGDCSQASPCSLATANSKATPGTTIIAASGTYNGNITITKGGAAGQFVTYKSQEKHGATIVGGEENNAVTINAPFVRFQDFTVTGEKTRNGFEVAANDVQIIGNHIHHITQWKTGGTGWEGGAGIDTDEGGNLSNLLFDGNHIHHVGAPGSTEQLVHGMYLATHVTNSVVSNNVITDVEDFGLHPYDETEASGWVFVNNTIVNTGRGILQAPNGVTRNNIVFNTRGAAYDIRGSGNVITNNIAGGTGSAGNGIGSGVTKADPMFVSASDFHLKPGSPAIDKGTTENAPQTDYDGKTRPQGAGIDLGAFESGGTGTNPVPSTVVLTPQFGGIGTCPGNPACPTPGTPSVISGGAAMPTSTGSNPTSGPQNPVPSTPTIEPCESTTAIADHKSKHKKKRGGISRFMEQLINFFLEFINMLIKLLGGTPLPTMPNPQSPGEGPLPTSGTNPLPTVGNPNQNPGGNTNPSPTPCPPGGNGNGAPTDLPTAQPTQNATQPTTPLTQAVAPSATVSQTPNGSPTAATCGGSANTPASPVTGYTLTKCEDFNGTSIPSGWTAYNGGGGDTVVGAGRKPEQCTVGNGVLTQTQNAYGATCGMSSNFAQKYGYWEVKMRAYTTGVSGSAPHPVLILWPDTDVWADGELDYFESDLGDAEMGVFFHCVGDPSKNCYSTTSQVDFSQWHVYGFEWTAAGFKGYVDGREIYSTDGKGSNPSVSMHQTIQLDNLSGQLPVNPGKMEVDWVHMYAK